MALKVNLADTAIGVAFDDTYARIISLRVDKERSLLHVSHYATREARINGAQPVLDRIIVVATSELKPGSTPLETGYNWLKLHPEYKDATDC